MRNRWDHEMLKDLCFDEMIIRRHHEFASIAEKKRRNPQLMMPQKPHPRTRQGQNRGRCG
jgi:hypothetical protein